MQSAYDAFMKTQPELEAFEAELKKYMAIETEVTNISPIYNIGTTANSGLPGRVSPNEQPAVLHVQVCVVT